jgi:subtilisin family serine protease/subtilisin-like proprotein convertase family protein
MTSTRSRTINFVLGAALASVAWGCNPAQPSPPSTGLTAEYATDSIIVRFRSPPMRSGAVRALARIHGAIQDNDGDGVDDRFAHIAGGRLAVVRLDKGADVDAAIAELSADPDVVYAERNHVVHAVATPNDPRFGDLYGLHNSGQNQGTADADIDAVEAWDHSIGSSTIVVGVIDTGVDYTHEDLAANMWVNPGEIPDNGLDDDGNGVIDDIHGFNAITGSGNPFDDHSHGTHCSGTIGAVGNNGVGVVGVNWQVQIMALKFLAANGSGFNDDAISAIDYAIAQRNAGVNLRVLSNSWGGDEFSQALLDAIREANDAGILFVAAAGNSASDNDLITFYPAGYDAPNMVAVAATDRDDRLAAFSSFGARTVHVGAPGVDILSTVPNNGYTELSGTSMATPHVAGVAALVLSANDTLSVSELKDVILASGDPIPALEGSTVSGRRVNAASAIRLAGPRIPRFRMAASPPKHIISQEESATYGIDILSVAGFDGEVLLTATADPPLAATVTVTPAVTAPGTGTLTIATTRTTAVGTYAVTVSGQSGDLVQSRTVSLRIRPFGTVGASFSSRDTPIAIPDNAPAGVASAIEVQQTIAIEELELDANLTHSYLGDLVLTLTSPAGTTVTLHNRAGGSHDDIHTTYVASAFTGEAARGTWILRAADLAAVDLGTLDDWTLRVTGVPGGPTFSVAASSARHVVNQGDNAAFVISVGAFDRFSGDVALAVTSVPPLTAAATFTPVSVAAPGSSTLDIAVDRAATPGDYALTITGTGPGGATRADGATLRVRPFGTVDASLSSKGPPIDIPDDTPAGIASSIDIADPIAIAEATVEVAISHPFIGDLVVKLIGPDGTTAVLHDRSGGAIDDIKRTFVVGDFAGKSSAGTWRLVASDNAVLDAGTLDRWTLRVSGVPISAAVGP